MAPRSFWKGYLKLSLVTCPVAMTPAVTESEKVRFHTLNRVTGNRVESRYVDAESGEPVDEDEEVKGYQSGADQYVALEDEEVDSVALESTHTIDIDMFAPRDSISWIWYDRPHYLVPDDSVGEEAFSVIRDAMAATGMVGISRLVRLGQAGLLTFRFRRASTAGPTSKSIGTAQPHAQKRVLFRPRVRPSAPLQVTLSSNGHGRTRGPAMSLIDLVRPSCGPARWPSQPSRRLPPAPPRSSAW
jgi:Ku70/Ku80 beta-barrel domain